MPVLRGNPGHHLEAGAALATGLATMRQQIAIVLAGTLAAALFLRRAAFP
ncbi:hypothetical protein [Streptomyces sp. NPDC055992]